MKNVILKGISEELGMPISNWNDTQSDREYNAYSAVTISYPKENPVNIQIFGTTKCFDTKKAQRYFKERNVKFQTIDMKEKGLSKGEYTSVCKAVGRDNMIDEKCKDKELLGLITYISEEDKDEKILENQKILKTPIVRNGNLATVGFCPAVWKEWK